MACEKTYVPGVPAQVYMKDSALGGWHKENNETPVAESGTKACVIIVIAVWYVIVIATWNVLQKCWPIQLQELNRRRSISLDNCSVPTKQMKKHSVVHPCES